MAGLVSRVTLQVGFEGLSTQVDPKSQSNCEVYQPVVLIVDLSLARVVQHSPLPSHLSMSQCSASHRAHVCV